MTTMQKAAAYDKALKDIKAVYPNLKGEVKLAVEHAFPELKESEDEKIMGDIMEAVENWLPYERVEEIRAYLREHKPTEWSEEDENKLHQVMEVLLADKTIALRENPHCKALHRAYDELLDWLKSLRPQPHWKPDEAKQ